MEAKIKKMFDYQRFEGNERLSNICSSVERKYADADELSDDELYMVAAGIALEKQKTKIDVKKK